MLAHHSLPLLASVCSTSTRTERGSSCSGEAPLSRTSVSLELASIGAQHQHAESGAAAAVKKHRRVTTLNSQQGQLGRHQECAAGRCTCWACSTPLLPHLLHQLLQARSWCNFAFAAVAKLGCTDCRLQTLVLGCAGAVQAHDRASCGSSTSTITQRSMACGPVTPPGKQLTLGAAQISCKGSREATADSSKLPSEQAQQQP